MTRLVTSAALLVSMLAPLGALRADPSAGSVDPRWDAWVGCWQAEMVPVSLLGQSSSQPGAASLAPSVRGGPIVCVVPTSDPSTVQVATVLGDSVMGRNTIAVTGEQRTRAREGCTGWESAAWSSDGTRVYLRSEDACPRGLARTSTGVLAMSPMGEWIDVQGVTVGGNTGVRTVRYHSVGIPSALPADLAAALTAQTRGRSAAVSAARAAAGAPLTNATIIDASRHLDPAVAEAWVLASGQHIKVDSRQLVALADAGVPGKVTDALVALSYPREFALNDASGSGDAVALQDHRASDRGAYNGIVTGRVLPVFIDPYGYSPYGYGAYGYSPYYGYAPYYGNLSYYGYAPYYGYASPYGGWIAPPVIVLKGSSGTVSGRAVKGHGYEPSGPVSGTRTAQPRTPPPPPPTTTTEAPPPSSSSSTQRTAHQRP